MTARPDPDHDRRMARQARTVSVVLVVTMGLWIGAQWLGGRMGWQSRFAFLFDMAAGAAFFWALVVTYQIWRKRQR